MVNSKGKLQGDTPPKGPCIYDVSHFGGRGGQSKSDILLRQAAEGMPEVANTKSYLG